MIGPVPVHQSFGFQENLQVENEANESQQQIPGQDLVHVSQIDGAGVNGQVSSSQSKTDW